MWHRAMSHRAARLLHLLATGTAQVLHQALCFKKKINYNPHLCSSFTQNPGQMNEWEKEEKKHSTGVEAKYKHKVNV